MTEKLRWKQRFASFSKAYAQLEQALGKKDYTTLERAGLIKTFEFTWELAWKTMRDYLQYQGEEVSGPRDAVKQAFKNGLIDEDQAWLDMLEARNFMAHIYDEDKSRKTALVIRKKFFPLIRRLLKTLKDK